MAYPPNVAAAEDLAHEMFVDAPDIRIFTCEVHVRETGNVAELPEVAKLVDNSNRVLGR